MRTILILASLVTVALAGCAEESAPPAEEDPTFDGFDDAKATETTGLIRGVVVDSAIVPIEGALVQIQSLDLETRTNENGAFVFADLEPGAYFLQASKLGYKSTQTSAQVVAGVDKPESIRINLLEDPESLPYTTLEVFEGYLQCGAGLGGVGALNPCAVTESVNTFNVATSPDLNATQIEMVWKGTNAFGDGLGLGIYDPNSDFSDFVGVDGGSPLTLRVTGAAIEAHYGEDMESYLARVFPGAGNDLGTLTVVAEQRFEIFVTNFYGFAPDEGWTFLEDGEHELPS